MRRLGLAGSALALVACGIAYAPGDFLAEGSAPAAPATDGGPSADANAPTPDAGAGEDGGPSTTRILMFGGDRTAFGDEPAGLVPIAETMMTTLSPTGALGTWTFDVPPPATGTWTRAILANGKVYLEGAASFAEASFTDHVTSAWTSAPIVHAPNSVHPGWIVDPFAFHESSALEQQQFELPIFDDGGVGNMWEPLPTMAESVRADATLVRAGAFVYALGGRGQGVVNKASDPDVEIAPYFDAGGFGDLSDINPMFAGDAGSVGDAGATYGVFAPVVATGANRIVVAGGLVGANDTIPTDVVIAARVTDPTTGALEPWVTLTPLPATLKDFALVVTDTMIVVFGGYDGKAVHNDVYALTIGGDGSYGTTWNKIGILPGGRSGITAVTY